MDRIEEEKLNEVSGGTRIPYLVQTGDTLDDIAKHFHCTVEDLCKWNNIKEFDTIYVNQKLIIKF